MSTTIAVKHRDLPQGIREDLLLFLGTTTEAPGRNLYSYDLCQYNAAEALSSWYHLKLAGVPGDDPRRHHLCKMVVELKIGRWIAPTTKPVKSRRQDIYFFKSDTYNALKDSKSIVTVESDIVVLTRAKDTLAAVLHLLDSKDEALLVPFLSADITENSIRHLLTNSIVEDRYKILQLLKNLGVDMMSLLSHSNHEIARYAVSCYSIETIIWICDNVPGEAEYCMKEFLMQSYDRTASLTVDQNIKIIRTLRRSVLKPVDWSTEVIGKEFFTRRSINLELIGFMLNEGAKFSTEALSYYILHCMQ
jgi:hypothetical protein